MKSSAGKIKLAGYDDLFQSGHGVEASGERMQEIPLSELFPFKDHPFQVRDDPPDLAHARIYDRILERCAPILFAGKNFREDNAASTKAAAREIVTDRK